MNRPVGRRAGLGLLGLVLGAMVAGCSDGGDAQPAPTASPDLLPYTHEQLRITFEQTARQLLVPGAVLLLRSPAGEFTATYGVSALGTTVPVSVQDHIRVGSNTKTWTATAILQLIQEGRLQLQDPVATYRPDVPNGEHITIEQLLNMRSGLFNYSETRELNQTLDAQPLKVWQPEELLALAFANTPYFPPGQGFHYSNTNYVLLGLIAESLDRKPLAQIFRDRLFTPLGLTQTLLAEPASHAIPAPHPQGYMYGTNLLTLDDPALPADMQAAARAGTLLPGNQTNSNPSWAWSAGAGISTATELATWVEAMNGGKMLNAPMQQRRMNSLQRRAPDDNGALYGQGIAQFGKLFGHTGELPGFNSFMGNDPANKLTLIVWTNLAPAANGLDPASTIAKNLLDQIYRPTAPAGN